MRDDPVVRTYFIFFYTPKAPFDFLPLPYIGRHYDNNGSGMKHLGNMSLINSDKLFIPVADTLAKIL